MNYFVDVNYPGLCYCVADELKTSFVNHMTSEGAALRNVPWAGRGEDLCVVTGVEETREFWGLHTQKAAYWGHALTIDQLWQIFVYIDENGQMIKLTDAGLKPVTDEDKVYMEGSDLLKPPKMDSVTGEIPFDDEEDLEPESDPDAELFNIQDRMNGIRVRY